MLLPDHAAPPHPVDRALAALGLRAGLQTRPELLTEILEGEMRLGDHAPRVAGPESLNPLRDAIAAAIRRRHPAIETFLGDAAGEGGLAGARPHAERVLHRMFALELVVREMIASPEFCVRLRTHYAEQRRQLGGGSALGVGRSTRSPFETAKFLTLDATFSYYLGLRTKPDLSAADLQTRGRGLRLNLFEAVAADHLGGYHANARIGRALARTHVPPLSVEGPERAVVQRFEDGWTSRYHAWNLAFVCGNVGNADWMLPKLLIPAVIDAEPGHYLHARVLALWVSAHALLFHRLATGSRDPEVTPEMAGIARALAQSMREREHPAAYESRVKPGMRPFTRLS